MDGSVYHIFTDGSSKNDKATWAITILHQADVDGKHVYYSVGYAAGHVNDDLGACDPSAMDAEATAIIAMAEFAFGQSHQRSVNIYCHFDALLVGFGAMGECNIPVQQGSQSERQRLARIVMTILESKSKQMDGDLKGIHVKAHQGHPWNEMSDSIAKAAWWGWMPTVDFDFRSRPLLHHPLAAWAWIEVAPTPELADLRAILENAVPDQKKGSLDSTLSIPNHTSYSESQTAKIVFATVNVGTLDMDMVSAGRLWSSCGSLRKRVFM